MSLTHSSVLLPYNSNKFYIVSCEQMFGAQPHLGFLGIYTQYMCKWNEWRTACQPKLNSASCHPWINYTNHLRIKLVLSVTHLSKMALPDDQCMYTYIAIEINPLKQQKLFHKIWFSYNDFRRVPVVCWGDINQFMYYGPSRMWVWLGVWWVWNQLQVLLQL